mmetsp:Transcript_17766/g.46492  ORF Transcript_17766/g.46492 Transcript_17766/m.46492 type:complete len:204 (-) Transcript_17766:739-1350(-)
MRSCRGRMPVSSPADPLGLLVVTKHSHDHCCVVDHLLLPHPAVVRLLDQLVHHRGAIIVPVCHIDHLLVRHEFPEAVRSQDKALVILSDIELRELELGADTSVVCDLVTERTRHGETGDIHVAEPNAWRSVDTVIIPHSEHAAALIGGAESWKGGVKSRLCGRRERPHLTTTKHVDVRPARHTEHGLVTLATIRFFSSGRSGL